MNQMKKMRIWKKCRITMIFPTVIPVVFHNCVDKYETKDDLCPYKKELILFVLLSIFSNFGDESPKLLRLGKKINMFILFSPLLLVTLP